MEGVDNDTPTTGHAEKDAESGVTLSETSWIDRLTPEELAGLDDFDRGMLLDELAFRQRRVEQVEKEKSVTLAGAMLVANAAQAARQPGPAEVHAPPEERKRASARSTASERQPVLDERDLPVFLLPGDVAALLRTTVKAVYAKVERGQLAGVVRDKTRILFDRDVLLRSLHGRGR